MSEASEVIDLLREILQSERQEIGLFVPIPKKAPHEGVCSCTPCRLSRYELPVPAEGEALTDQLIPIIKQIDQAAERAVDSGAKTSIALVLEPLPPEAERILLTYRVERLNACARATAALSALLPEQRRPPEGVLHGPLTLENAERILAFARDKTRTKLEAKRREVESERIAEDAVKQTIADDAPRTNSAVE